MVANISGTQIVDEVISLKSNKRNTDPPEQRKQLTDKLSLK